MKISGAIIIFLAASWYGMAISNSLKSRYDFLERFITALEILKTEIAFAGTDLKTAFERASSISGLDIFSYAAEYIEKEGLISAWKRAVDEKAMSDKELLLLVSSKLGKTDLNGQIRHIEYVAGMINEAKKDAFVRYERTGGLYRKGGVLLGAFAVLMLL